MTHLIQTNAELLEQTDCPIPMLGFVSGQGRQITSLLRPGCAANPAGIQIGANPLGPDLIREKPEQSGPIQSGHRTVRVDAAGRVVPEVSPKGRGWSDLDRRVVDRWLELRKSLRGGLRLLGSSATGLRQVKRNVQMPRYRCKSSGCRRRSSLVPSITRRPLTRMIFRLVIAYIAAKLLSTMIVAIPVSRISRRILQISCAIRGASPSVASSSIKSKGLVISARPMVNICCSPPESCCPPWSSRLAREGNVSRTRS